MLQNIHVSMDDIFVIRSSIINTRRYLHEQESNLLIRFALKYLFVLNQDIVI